VIEEATQEILGQVSKQLTENQLKAVIPEAYSIDLIVSSQYVQFS